MDQKPKLMTPFDMLVSSSSLYTLKLMLPFAPASIQRSLAIYIKFSELKATMEKNQMEERKRTQENLNEYKRMLRMRQG